ncbi:MFS transporter [Nocardioides solisilvae]|uniref:MFS transporter n=1 Tax=Nocardioides solisilvae TaxID=1542435 RepID=UPI000D74A977|nr:MFS transporter [Nocardioides solisilvae]
MTLTEREVRRRFLVLVALRWLPTGFLMPVLVLLPLDRGLTLSELGLAVALQGLVVLALELPTGGLADSLGRRRLLLAAQAVSLVSLGVLLVAESLVAFAAVFALQGVHRALDSGPLEAWYVESARAADPGTSIEAGMGAQGAVLAVAIAAGSATSGLLVAWDPVPGLAALALPVVVALALQAVTLLVTAVLMVEAPRPTAGAGTWASVVATPRVVRAGFALVRADRVLLALVAVELFWGFGMVAFESLTPVRLAEVLDSDRAAAAVLGPAATGAWLASAAGAAATPWLCRRWGVATTAAVMRVAQGAAVLAMGLLAGVAGILVAYLACYCVHGLSNAAHMTLLHERADDGVRATVISLNSMVAQPAGALGMVALTALADVASVGLAMVVGGVALAVAAPLYLPARRAGRASAGTRDEAARVV